MHGASSQSQVMKNRNEFLKKIEDYEKKYQNQNNVPRPPHWSGWRVEPLITLNFGLKLKIEFMKDLIIKKNEKWIREILYP